jgi:hypothetical protein
MSLNLSHKKHHTSIEITLNILRVSQKRNDSFRLIVTARYSDFASQLMANLHPTVDLKALKPTDRFVAEVIALRSILQAK